MSQHFTFHWKLLGLVSRIEKSGTGDHNFGKWKGTFRSVGPVTVDHLQSWSQIFQSDQTEMVRSMMYQLKLPELWVEWKAPLDYKADSQLYSFGISNLLKRFK